MSKLKLTLLIYFIFSLYCEEIRLEEKPLSSETESFQGLELSSPTKITKIGFTLLTSEPKDYLLGVIQGSNDKTFFDSIPLYMITEELEPNRLHLVQIHSNQKFQYIRFVNSEEESSTVIELEAYGDLESFEEESDNYYQPTNLPLLVINTENGEMPEGRDKTSKVRMNAVIIKEGNIHMKQTGTIKLRGNSSLNSEKKPYLLNFDVKTTFLDMPCKDKKWTLIPNMYDKSLLRNFLGYKISFIFGLKFSPSCRYVDLILNSNYRGNYMICDKVEVKKDRINITEMDETCVEEPEISGGYLLSGAGAQFDGGETFKTAKGITLAYEYPELDEILDVQKKYIKNKLDEIEEQCYNDNVENIDLESFVRYFLVEDFTANRDAIFNSFYFYKDRGSDKIYFGPVWDFDLAFDNAMDMYPTNEKKNFAYKFCSSDGTTKTFVSKVLSNDVVLKKVKDTWNEMTNTVFTKEIMLDFLDEQIKYLNESQRLNFIKWDVLKTRLFMEARCRGSFQAEADYLKKYIDERFDVFGEIVRNATKESIINETKSDTFFGNHRGFRNNKWGNNIFGDDEDEQCEGGSGPGPSPGPGPDPGPGPGPDPGPWGGNKSWGHRNNTRNEDNPWNSWGNKNNNNEL